MTRLPELREEDLDERGRRVWASVTGGRRGDAASLTGPNGGLIGPFNAMVHSPAVGEPLAAVGEALRFESSIDGRLHELAIITVGAHWRANFEWWVHSGLALREGVSEGVIAAIGRGEPPELTRTDEATVHGFTRQLLDAGRVDDDVYAAALDLLGPSGIADLVFIAGYYSLVSFTLNAFQVPLPEGTELTWPE